MVEVVVPEGPPTKRVAARRQRRRMAPVLRALPKQMRGRVGQRSRNQGTISSIMQSEMQGATDTPEGMAVVRLAVDPFISAGSQSHVLGWPDGVSQPSVAPHFFGEMADVTVASGNYSGITPFPTMPNALDWSYIQVYDADVGVLNECFYVGDLATTTNITFRTQQTEYALKVLNNSSDYTASRLWSAGFTLEFTGTITTDSGKSTVVQIPGNAKLVGPTDVDGVAVFEYHVNLLGVDDPSVGDRVAAAQMLNEVLPNADTRRYRSEAKLGHCSVIKSSRSEMPFDNFEHADTGTVVSQAYYYNPLYDAFFGSSDTPASGTGTGTRIQIPFDIPAQRKHTLMVSHYHGLNPQGAFRIKTYEFVENTVALNSVLQPYTRDGLMIDRDAMDLVAAIHTKMESGYPSSYNFLGKLWKGIKKGFGWVDKVVDSASDIIKILPIPGAKEIVDTLNPIRKTIMKPVLSSTNGIWAGRHPSAKSMLNGMARLAIGLMMIFSIASAQPQQVIVCNNPSTPGICGPNLPVSVLDGAVVAAIGDLGSGDQEILNEINMNLETSDGFDRAIARGLFSGGDAAYPLLPTIQNTLAEISTTLTSMLALLTAGVPVQFPSNFTSSIYGIDYLNVGVTANLVNRAHFLSDPSWSVPITFADTTYNSCFQLGLSEVNCVDGYVPLTTNTGVYSSVEGSWTILPVPISTDLDVASASLVNQPICESSFTC